MKRGKGLLIIVLLMVSMIGFVSASQLLLIDSGIQNECDIIHEGDSFFLNDNPLILHDNSGFEQNIKIQLDGFRLVVLNNNLFGTNISRFDFDYAEAEMHHSSLGEFNGFAGNGEFIVGRDYYSPFSSPSNNLYIIYSDIDLVNEETGKTIDGRIRYAVTFNKDSDEFEGCSIHGGYLILDDDNEERISALESWKETVDDFIDSLFGLFDDHDERIESLESSSSGGGSGGSSNETFPQYLDYLSASDRKKIICGYAEDNHLESISDLGYDCTLTYRQTSRGETASCRCKKL